MLGRTGLSMVAPVVIGQLCKVAETALIKVLLIPIQGLRSVGSGARSGEKEAVWDHAEKPVVLVAKS